MRFGCLLLLGAIAVAQEAPREEAGTLRRLPEHVWLYRLQIDPNVREPSWTIEIPLCGTFPNGRKWVMTFPGAAPDEPGQVRMIAVDGAAVQLKIR